ncbi:hypothetical protein [Roseospirillum parvum]|uniref:Lipoprotein n=1 Tax=Roseospirillum parvum TaxID=83401 RepID=A0A1G7WDV2_9PROT|nr:hypothetical protein [Roseospirillum parvum]SDG70116.1 hypothetical protein SAMN05421742_102161 [Roseospirillum parvum]
MKQIRFPRAVRLGSLALAAGLLAGCQTLDLGMAPPPVDLSAPPQVFTGSHTLLGETFPLPPGEWELAVSESFRTPGSRAATQYYTVLVSRANGVIDRAIVTWVQAKHGRGSTYWSGFEGCLTEADDPTVQVAEVKANADLTETVRGPDLDCWHVRALNLGTAGTPHPIVADMDAYARTTGDYLPVTMLGARFARKDISTQRAYVEYLFNPDLLYPADKPWTADDWTRTAVAADPGKQAVVVTLTEWARDWYRRVHGAAGS